MCFGGGVSQNASGVSEAGPFLTAGAYGALKLSFHVEMRLTKHYTIRDVCWVFPFLMG